MIDALSMDYIRTARAKGLKEKVVIYSHAWRNALLPIITSIIGWFISIFSGFGHHREHILAERHGQALLGGPEQPRL